MRPCIPCLCPYDALLIASRFVDGESEASVSYYPYELAGMPSPDAYNHSLKYAHCRPPLYM